MSNAIESCEYTAKPDDRRCKFWSKIVRAGADLPLPRDVHGASDVPGPYMRVGDTDEILAGDYVLTGEENHHRKRRGWTYNLATVKNGELVWLDFGADSDAKQWLREQGNRELLTGAGQVAAMIREIHVRRLRGEEAPCTSA